MTWLTEHLAWIGALSTLLCGAGAEARWRLATRVAGRMIRVTQAEYYLAQCAQREREREIEQAKKDALTDREIALLREDVTNLQNDVARLLARLAAAGVGSGSADPGTNPMLGTIKPATSGT